MPYQYDYRWYEAERRSEHRTYARDHGYAEWVWFKRWEAGEMNNPAPLTLSRCLDFLRCEYPLTMEKFDAV